MDHQELGTIEREIFVEAAPEIVFDVVSSPEHVRQWWPDDARYEREHGSSGSIVFGDGAEGGTETGFTVLSVEPPRSFSFRWTHAVGERATEHNSLLVRFDLEPARGGTLLRMTETGFREQGWEIAVLEQQYTEHVTGWAHFLPRIAPYVQGLATGPSASSAALT